MDTFLVALSFTLHGRERETYGHSQRVSLYAGKLARVLALPAERIREVERAGLLHDVGKVAVADSILLKPGPLTAAETAAMREHPRVGWEIVHQLACIGETAELILHQHERYDGRGYPHGLHGENIPLGTHLLALADTLDAMTTKRPYREPRTWPVAYEEIRRERGCPFGPRWLTPSPGCRLAPGNRLHTQCPVRGNAQVAGGGSVSAPKHRLHFIAFAVCRPDDEGVLVVERRTDGSSMIFSRLAEAQRNVSLPHRREDWLAAPLLVTLDPQAACACLEDAKESRTSAAGKS